MKDRCVPGAIGSLALVLLSPPAASPVSAVVFIQAGAVRIAPGQQGRLPVFLRSQGEEVAGTGNDLAWPPPLRVLATPDGRPDCAVNPALGKEATAFAFRPYRCGGEACSGLRAVVLAFDNVDAIADGSVLYTCAIAVAADAGAEPIPIAVRNARSSDALGRTLPTAGYFGFVHTAGTPSSHLIVTSPRTPPGGRAELSLRVETDDPLLSLVTAVIRLAPPLTFAASDDGQPACATPDDATTTVAFESSPQEAAGAAIALTAHVAPVPDLRRGIDLVRCAITVPADLAVGTYRHSCTARIGEADDALVDGVCDVSGLEVAFDPTATPTPTQAPPWTGQPGSGSSEPITSRKPTANGANTPTATASRTALPSVDADGCQVGAPGADRSLAGALIPFALAVMLRCRRRRSRRDRSPTTNPAEAR